MVGTIDFEEAINSGKILDIWRITDIMLDVRNGIDNEYDKQRVDDLIKQLGIQPDGPTIVLSEKVQTLLNTLQEEGLIND